jgi:hypothetical protein
MVAALLALARPALTAVTSTVGKALFGSTLRSATTAVSAYCMGRQHAKRAHAEVHHNQQRQHHTKAT